MYQVDLELYSGPLDLLLYLVRRHELDICDLPIAQITEQFQEFLSVLEYLDLEMVGEFIVLASTLVEIKSRLALPTQEEEQELPEDQELNDDARNDLVARLLQYKMYKDAAYKLQQRADAWAERYPRLSEDRPNGKKDPTADRITDIEIWDLLSAFGRVMNSQGADGQHRIRMDETPLHVYVDRIATQVRTKGEVRFFEFFEGETTRSVIVGMFLAILELIRHHQFRAIQDSRHGDIMVLPPESDLE